MHFRQKAKNVDTRAWADQYRNAPWVTSQQLLSHVKSARLHVNIDKNMLKYFTRAKLESAVIQGMKARGITVDPKSDATVVVEFTGSLEQDNAINRALIVCKLMLPATVLRKTGFRAFDAIARGNQQVHQMPRLLIRGINDTVFYNQARRFVSTTLTGDSKKLDTKRSKLKLVENKNGNHVAFYMDYHAAHAVRKFTADHAWATLPSLTQPRVRVGGDAHLINADSFQKYWVRKLQEHGLQFDTESTARVDHLIVAVTNSHARDVKHFASVVTILEGDVVYEFDGKFVRHQGWLLHNPYASIANKNLGSALSADVDRWSKLIAETVKKNK